VEKNSPPLNIPDFEGHTEEFFRGKKIPPHNSPKKIPLTKYK